MIPKLFVFTISHFCEKARWALDFYGIDYELVPLAPGPHALAMKKLGAPASSLPVLQLTDDFIQGSSAIIDWAHEHRANTALSLQVSEADTGEAQKIEQRLDRKIGVHVRRMFYSEALVEHPDTVKPVFADGMSAMKRLGLNLSWPLVRKLMIKGMDLGYEQGLQSQAILDEQISWLDGLLADGRHYLLGEHFSRVDLTAASLLARLAMVETHPNSRYFVQPPRMQAKVSQWQQGPTLQWVKKIYQDHR